MKVITDDNLKAINKLPSMVQGYKDGEIDLTRFKAFRVPLGVYEQRTKETYMVRTRIPGGVIEIEQLEKIIELADKYSGSKVHLTTRQDVQFQNVDIDDIEKIVNELKTVNVSTYGTGGNTVRNIQSSPLSGVSVDDVFDVTPYMAALTEKFAADPTSLNLPRKYKISFSNSEEDTVNAGISDLGLIATIKDGKKGFKVYIGGGLGGGPRVSVKLTDFIEANEVFAYAEALKELFYNEGDRSNKHKARIRYIVARLGEEKFVELFYTYLEKVKKEKDVSFEVTEIEKNYEELESSEIKIPNLAAQKQKGYYSLYVHATSGNVATESLKKVVDFVKGLGYEATIRFTNTQSFYVRDLKYADAEKLFEITKDFNNIDSLYQSVTCAGASTCQLGLCLAQNLLKGIIERFKDESEAVKAALPRLYISGCPNSCGQHYRGIIGLSGRAKRMDDGLLPAYSIFVNGKVGHNARLGDSVGEVAVKKLPDFFVELANKLIASKLTSEEYVEKNIEEIKALVEKYSTVESFNENPDLYYDFYTDERFSLKNRGAGECSIGVLDVINLDITKGENFFKEYQETKNNELIFKSVVSASRALLILKALDSDKPREIFERFTNLFITTGYVKKDIAELFNILVDYKLGNINDLSSNVEAVKYLVERVKEMYKTLSPTLEITVEKEHEGEEAVSDEKSEAALVDLRGVKCPINFVKAKVALSQIKSGDEIGFYLDDGEPINNVPKSIEKEGHEILKLDSNFDGYNLLVVKKG